MELNHKDTEGKRFTEEDYNRLTNNVIGAAIEVHRELGPGLLESVYALFGKRTEVERNSIRTTGATAGTLQA